MYGNLTDRSMLEECVMVFPLLLVLSGLSLSVLSVLFLTVLSLSVLLVLFVPSLPLDGTSLLLQSAREDAAVHSRSSSSSSSPRRPRGGGMLSTIFGGVLDVLGLAPSAPRATQHSDSDEELDLDREPGLEEEKAREQCPFPVRVGRGRRSGSFSRGGRQRKVIQHTVGEKDTVQGVALRFDMTLEELQALNHGLSHLHDTLFGGETLFVYGPVCEEGCSVEPGAGQASSSSASASLPGGPPPPPPPPPPAVGAAAAATEPTASSSGASVPKSLSDPPQLFNANRAVLLSEEQMAALRAYLPLAVRQHDWFLSYSTQEHGTLLNTLYLRWEDIAYQFSRKHSNVPSIMVIYTSTNKVIGCYASDYWRVHSDSFFGRHECFVFSCNPDLKVYRSSRRNNNYQQAKESCIAMGGSPNAALWVDKSLRHGASGRCHTFDSPCLTNQEVTVESFQILALEVWALIRDAGSFEFSKECGFSTIGGKVF